MYFSHCLPDKTIAWGRDPESCHLCCFFSSWPAGTWRRWCRQWGWRALWKRLSKVKVFWQDELFCFCLERLLFAWQPYSLVVLFGIWRFSKCLNLHYLNILMYTDNRHPLTSIFKIFNLLLKPHIRGLNNPGVLKLPVLFGASPAAGGGMANGQGGIWAIPWWFASIS